MKLTLVTLLVVAASINTVYSDLPKDRPKERNKLPYSIVCYWGTWAFYRPGNDGKFEAEEINPNLCTHVYYGFAKLDSNNKIALYDPGLDGGDEDWKSGLTWGHGMIRRMNVLRDYNKNLATVISIGGWNEGSNKYSAMASNPASRKVFVQSVLDFLKEHDLDGLDLDWEYPSMKAVNDQTRTPGRDQDKQDYVSLLKELHEAFEPHGYILSAAVSAGKPTIDRAYDVPQVSKYLDLINLMAYDFHGGWDNYTAHNAPLYPLPGANEVDKEFTVSYAVDYWLKLGADPKKLILGVPLYGRTFTLKGSQNGMGAPVIGSGGQSGPITRIVGMLGYNEICAMVKAGWDIHWNDIQQVPYATHANQWIGYDNVKSVQKKVDYAISKKLGGCLVWSIDTDDFTGHCGEGKYPLLKTISRSLNKVDGPDVTIPRTHATTAHPNDNQQTTKTPNTPPPHHDPHTDPPNGNKFVCKSAGFFKDPNSFSKFHQCVDIGNGKLKDYEFNCPSGTQYNENLHICE